MYSLSKILILILLFFLSACVSPTLKNSYITKLSQNLDIEYIFIPPSDEYHPYSLLHYSKKSGYTVLCSASILTNIPEKDLSKKLKESNIPDIKLAIGTELNFAVSLSQIETASAGLAHNNIKFVAISLSHGKKITMPSMHTYTVQENLANSQCKKEILTYSKSYTDSKYYIPNSMYKYTIKTSILDQNYSDITAQIPSTLKELIFAKAHLKVAHLGNMNFSGENLYIGFNGVTVTHETSLIIPKEMNPKNIVLDVTKIINKIKKEKK